jgi:hypothetical protein
VSNRRRWLMLFGEWLILRGQQCIDASRERRGIWVDQMKRVEQRHTKLEATRIGDEIVVKGCAQVVRFPIPEPK